MMSMSVSSLGIGVMYAFTAPGSWRFHVRWTDAARRWREPALFIVVGGSVAVFGHLILLGLIGVGWPAALANTAQAIITLELNFIGNYALTWRGLPRRAGFAWAAWRRFHVARGTGAVLTIATFPLLAALIGSSWAYWTLLGTAAVANFIVDKHWSFAGTRTRPAVRVAVVVGASVAGVILAALALDPFIVVVSVFMLVVTVTTLAFQLYKWWQPETTMPITMRSGSAAAAGCDSGADAPGEAVAGHTLDRLANLNHPEYWVMPIIDHPDDPGTARIAHAKAREYPDRVLVCPYPEENPVHNKPIGLNAAVDLLLELGIEFEWIGIKLGSGARCRPACSGCWPCTCSDSSSSRRSPHRWPRWPSHSRCGTSRRSWWRCWPPSRSAWAF